ncbi:MAG: beta-ketoacyl-[acyl-carrier-protein] synthase family protein [Porticoccaceae bacterium]|nr:beta-ketoacyl-[acyl-carrier-protein] synthase family protein [Porticoccaceae bacterium]
MTAVYLNHAGVICALGTNTDEVERNLFATTPPSLPVSDSYSPGRAMPLGKVDATLPPATIAGEDSRNNRLLAAALTPLLPVVEELKARYGRDRIGVVIGTSTSGIAEGEAALSVAAGDIALAADYHYSTQEFSAPGRFLARWLDLGGPCSVVSSACTSGGKALVSAARLLQLGVCDAVVAGGVDSLCRMTVAGFSALMVTADTPCNPFSINRRGINIGEGAALFVMTREPGAVRLAGWGESSDAHHISSPHPEGRGAEAAIRQALARADLAPEQIDYLNLHGTATTQNDQVEALAVSRVLGSATPCSSTKPLTGHTLAAAGAIEALLCWLLLQRDDGRLPPHQWDGQPDPAMPLLTGLGHSCLEHPVQTAMSNSFAFGGNNLSLILTRETP